MAEVSADADDCKARELEYVRNTFFHWSVILWNITWQLTLPLHSLLESGNFSDAEIVCGERSWKCHRAILTSRSTWFRKALSGPFEVSRYSRICDAT